MKYLIPKNMQKFSDAFPDGTGNIVFLGEKEVCKMLQIHHNTLLSWLDKGEFAPGYCRRKGSSGRFRCYWIESELNEWLCADTYSPPQASERPDDYDLTWQGVLDVFASARAKTMTVKDMHSFCKVASRAEVSQLMVIMFKAGALNRFKQNNAHYYALPVGE